MVVINISFNEKKTYPTHKSIKIFDISHEAKGVGKINNKIVFVKNSVPGDIVDVQITSQKKNYLEGYPIAYIQKSNKRANPFCEHFGSCGGCKWQHLQYTSQLEYKFDNLEKNLKKISGLTLPPIEPIIGSEQTTFFRNKLEFTFSNSRWLSKQEIDSEEVFEKKCLGFHLPKRFDKILDIQQCHLLPEPSSKIRLELKKFAIQQNIPFFDLKKQEGFLRNLIIRISSLGQIMIIIQVFQNKKPLIERILDHLIGIFPKINAVFYIINQKKMIPILI